MYTGSRYQRSRTATSLQPTAINKDKRKAPQKQNETVKKEKGKVEAEKEALQKKYETLKKEKEKVEAGSSHQRSRTATSLQPTGMSKDKSSKRKKETLREDDEELQQDHSLKSENERLVKEKEGLLEQNDILKSERDKLWKEKEALQKKYDSLEIENERLGKEKEDIQKQNDILKSERDKLVKEKEDLQKQNDSLKQEKETLGKDCEEHLQDLRTLKNEKQKVKEDFEELQKKTNARDYVLGREWKPITEARVNVTLDPDTASPSLTVSEDGSRVRFTGERSAEWPSVLGREGFTSGRHYWEVEVGEKGYWVLGVSTHPHEKSIPEKPGEGYWLVRLCRGKTCTAVSQSGEKILKLQKFCKVWGVHLDHEGGRLSFYNVETTPLDIHTLEGSFTGQVYPIFSPGSHDKAPLIINRKVNV